jgi:hypothetical protein
MLIAFLYLNFLDCPVMGPYSGIGLSTLVPRPAQSSVHSPRLQVSFPSAEELVKAERQSRSSDNSRHHRPLCGKFVGQAFRWITMFCELRACMVSCNPWAVGSVWTILGAQSGGE